MKASHHVSQEPFFPESIINAKLTNFVHEGNFYIHGGFDATLSLEVIPQLVQQINLKSGCKAGGKISIYVESSGGFSSYAYNIIALMERAKAWGITVETYVFGDAFSCGSLVACAGSPGSRFIGPYAEHLCHLGRASTGYSSNDVIHQRNADTVQEHFNRIRAIYMKYAKIKNLKKLIHDDGLTFRGQEIIKNGLADKMI